MGIKGHCWKGNLISHNFGSSKKLSSINSLEATGVLSAGNQLDTSNTLMYWLNGCNF